jgi:hypothetical protein
MGRTRATATVIGVAIGVVALTVTGAIGGTSSSGRASGPFAWLLSASLPSGWKVARIHGGAEFGYPPGWRAIKTDPGTASVALLGSGGQIDGFLNATPKQGAETLSNWRRFRPQHNRREGDRNVRVLAATDDARFRSGRASCVIDDYTTSKAHYREIACLVSGAHASAVVVAAAPSTLGPQGTGTLERAISTFTP